MPDYTIHIKDRDDGDVYVDCTPSTKEIMASLRVGGTASPATSMVMSMLTFIVRNQKPRRGEQKPKLILPPGFKRGLPS